MKTMSIITNNKVDVTRNGEECFLKRTITSISKNVKKQEKRYIIINERCNYYDEDMLVLDTEGNMTFDTDGNPITETVSILKPLGIKDKEEVITLTFAEINTYFEAIKDQIPSDLSKIESENLEEQIALLLLTQQNPVYNTVDTDWKLYTE